MPQLHIIRSKLGLSSRCQLNLYSLSQPSLPYLRLSRSLSTDPTPSPGQDGTPPPGFNAAAHRKPSYATTQPKEPSQFFSSSSTLNTESDWEENPDLSISTFAQLPSKHFGTNQHMIINQEFKEALRQILWQFRAPIRYAFAYGSGVFAQAGAATGESCHPAAPEEIKRVQQSGGKMIDFIFGVSYSQHWHALNLAQHRNHYSSVGSLGSYAVSQVQDKWGAGVYFNPYVTVNGTLIKYGVVNIDTLCKDLSEWNTLYLAGRLQKPVKILRDHPSVRLANQMNLLSAMRVALLLLPPDFNEHQLYKTIAGLSYMGDPRMSLGSEDPRKINNIVTAQVTNFRRLYAPLIDALPNVAFNDSACSDPDWIDNPEVNVHLAQDMDPIKRGNMVRRLPKSFRETLYFQYQSRFQIPRAEFNHMMEQSTDEDSERIHRREGTSFDRRIADEGHLKEEVAESIKKTISWPSTSQSIKGVVTAGFGRSFRYLSEKRSKYLDSKKKSASSSGDTPAAESKQEKK